MSLIKDIYKDWHKIRKNSSELFKKDIKNKWFWFILIIMLITVFILYNSENRYYRLAATAILVFWITSYAISRFMAIVFAAFVVGAFHIHLAREVKKGVYESTAI